MRTSITDKMMFQPAPEFCETAKRIVEAPAFKWKFHHVDVDRIQFLYEFSCVETDMAACILCVKQPYKNMLAFLLGNNTPEYVICVFGHHAEGKSEKWRQIVMLHELEHIQVDGKIKEHDVQDFKYILKAFGIDWQADRELPDITKLKPSDAILPSF